MTNSSNFNFSGVDAVALAKQYGTPLYIMSEDIIRNKINIVKESFIKKYPKTKAFYASKAFLSLHMCEILIDEDFGLDAVSAGEIYTGLKAGINPENMVFHGNNKTAQELEFAISNGVGKIVVDSISEIELLSGLTSDSNKKISLLIRINPSVEADTHKYMNTGQKDSKFGIPLPFVIDAIKKIESSKNLKYSGLHFHIGSQIYKNDTHILAVEKAISLISDIKKELGIDTDVLDIGGGFGVDYINETQTVNFPKYIDGIMDRFNSLFSEYGMKKPEIYIEPGRWIVADAGITIYSVGVIKDIPDVRTYVSVDGGMPDNIRPSLYGAEYRAIVANKINQKATKIVTIAGKCCETGDILIYDICLPEMERGDYLAVMDTGAYNYSMANNYNMIPKAALVFIKDGKAELSIQRETYDDLLSHEIAFTK